MANEAHLEILQKGVKAWNQWRQENSDIRPDLSEADLSRTNLSRADLSKVNLRMAKLNKAKLRGADLRGANLSGANLAIADLSVADLSVADLSVAQLRGADLSHAYLIRANLISANFISANLNGADLTDAVVAYTTFGNVDLSSVMGIETIHHAASSSIGIDTIYRSHGRIPEAFLRGAGVPDNFIEYMHSLVGTAFEFYSCFISYSTKDQPFADRLYADLQSNGVRCWFAPHDMQGGKPLKDQIDSAIRVHERLLLLLSPNSLKSEWVKTEIRKSLQRQTKKRRVLFPVCLSLPFERLKKWEFFDADSGKDLARDVREFYIPDFTRWKDHDSYQKEFKKLLRDLKKPDAARAKAGA
jgi:hypothetical protein